MNGIIGSQEYVNEYAISVTALSQRNFNYTQESLTTPLSNAERGPHGERATRVREARSTRADSAVGWKGVHALSARCWRVDLALASARSLHILLPRCAGPVAGWARGCHGCGNVRTQGRSWRSAPVHAIVANGCAPRGAASSYYTVLFERCGA